jgi:twitching motility two-component system response regulator PilG
MLEIGEEISGLMVLVFDDSTTIRRSAQIFLSQAKCEVIVAEDGFGALAKVVEHRPDIVFLYVQDLVYRAPNPMDDARIVN